MIRTLRLVSVLFSVALVAACSGIGETKVDGPQEPLGEFRLGHNIAVAKNAQKVPISRDATTEELEQAMKLAVDERFGAYQGRKLYHLGINVDAYALAPPGVPLVASPKSVLVVSANLWDDALGRKLHDEPKQFTVFENLTGETAVGSGLTQSAEVQLRNLTRNAAKMIQDWMLENPQWFEMSAEEIAAHDAALAAAAAAEAVDTPAPAN